MLGKLLLLCNCWMCQDLKKSLMETFGSKPAPFQADHLGSAIETS